MTFWKSFVGWGLCNRFEEGSLRFRCENKRKRLICIYAYESLLCAILLNGIKV
jgi:hypothetical protein